MRPRPVLLCILDGWGEAPANEANAIAAARTPVMDRLRRECPSTLIQPCGESVGLPPGQMGNSEVGHLNMGAGRIVFQEFLRINRAIKGGEFFENEAFVGACRHAKASGGTLHLFQLLGPGGVHAHHTHLVAMLELAKRQALKPEQVAVHAVLDGRDTPAKSAAQFLEALQGDLGRIGVGRVATLVGRYFSMDRDNRWERTKVGYDLYARGQGARGGADPVRAVQEAYARGESDEFLKPVVLDGAPLVKAGDSFVLLNFRPDRARQITRAFVDPAFAGFPREHIPDLHFAAMTQHDAAFPGFGVRVAFPPNDTRYTLGEHLSKLGLKQLRIAETEKYAHITYFFNGGREKPFPGEDRVLVPSQKVATYDLKPEMSAPEVTRLCLERIGTGTYDLVVLNYANPDMVGHTGKFEPAVKAVETVDRCLGQVLEAVLAQGGAALVTADHGNAEEMFDLKTQEPITSHTTNQAPFIVVPPRDVEKQRALFGREVRAPRDLPLRDDGVLSDVAPTVLKLMGLPVPSEMTAHPMF